MIRDGTGFRQARCLAAVTTVALASVWWSGCHDKASGHDRASRLPAIKVVDGAGLLFTYRAGDSFQTVDSVGKVPAWSKGLVRVMDPKVRNVPAGWVYVADLCNKTKAGSYPYKAMKLVQFEKTEARSCTGASGAPKLIAYVSSTCPVCAQAEAYLKKRGIPFVTRVVDKDPSAAAELARKAKSAGVPIHGVPVFDIAGKLVSGFDPNAMAAMARSAGIAPGRW